MKFLLALVLLLCVDKGTCTVSILCYEHQNLTGRFVYFQYTTDAGASGCCVGGAGSVFIYYPSSRHYLWYNCPTTTITQPLVCHQDATCTDAGHTTSSTGGTAVNECCLKGSNTFNVRGYDVCVHCTAPFQPPVNAQNVPQNMLMSGTTRSREVSGTTRSQVVSIAVLMGCVLALFGM